MSAWLDPLRAALDRIERPTYWFFRDDDAGWADQQLYALLDCFAEFRLPVDLAVIPIELSDELAAALLSRYRKTPTLLGLHQHGYSHTNHETTGRKCEFGSSRSSTQQAQDIALGASLLRAKLGAALDPIFTPPWNRCSSATVTAMLALGFQALSRDSKAAPLDVDDMAELPVSVDWSKRQNGLPVDGEVLGANLASAVEPPLIGVMLHHAMMGPEDLSALRELLELLSRHRHVTCLPMRTLAFKLSQVA